MDKISKMVSVMVKVMGEDDGVFLNPKAVIVDPAAQLLIVEENVTTRYFFPMRNVASWRIETERESGLVL